MSDIQPTHFSNHVVNSLTKRDITIHIREDSYVEATNLCQAGRKCWSNYFDSERTAEFLDDLSEVLGIGRVSLVQVSAGIDSLVWVHPQVALDIAFWISSSFRIIVTDLLHCHLSGQVSTRALQLAVTSVKNLAWAPSQEEIDESKLLLRELGNERGFYLIQVSANIVNFGKTDRPFKFRIKEHLQEFPNLVVFDLLPCNNPLQLETAFRRDPRIKIYKDYKRPDGSVCIEMIELTSTVTKASLKSIARELLNGEPMGKKKEIMEKKLEKDKVTLDNQKLMLDMMLTMSVDELQEKLRLISSLPNSPKLSIPPQMSDTAHKCNPPQISREMPKVTTVNDDLLMQTVRTWLKDNIQVQVGGSISRGEIWRVLQLNHELPKLLQKEFFPLLYDFFGSRPVRQHLLTGSIGWKNYSWIKQNA